MKKINVKKIKKETMYMMFTVICLTITMVSTSYSIFFDVKTNQNEQVITAGSLSVQFTNGSTSLSNAYVYPYSDEDAILSSSQSIFYVQNSGSTNGVFNFTITEGENHTLSNQYLKLAVFEYNASTNESTILSDVITLGECLKNENGEYVVYSSTLSTGSTATYAIKFWLNEFSGEEIVSETIDLEINVLSEVLEAVMLYDFKGTMKDADGSPVGGATISLNNGSISSTTNSSGVYNLEGVRTGTYGVTITLEDGSVIQDIIFVDEDITPSVVSKFGSFMIYGGLTTNLLVDFTIDENSIKNVEAN